MTATCLCQIKCTRKRRRGFSYSKLPSVLWKTKRAAWFLERDLIVSAEFKEPIRTHKWAKPHLAESPKQRVCVCGWLGGGEWGVGECGIRGQLIFTVKSQCNTANPHCQAGASMQTWIRPHPEHPCPQGTSTQLLLDGKSFVKSFATASQRG